MKKIYICRNDFEWNEVGFKEISSKQTKSLTRSSKFHMSTTPVKVNQQLTDRFIEIRTCS